MVIIIFFFGLFIGSFLNVCISRIPSGESIAYPPSHCSNCKVRLKPLDLIPIFSYGFLKGRCRYCKNKISLEYPLVELITGFLFALLYLKFGLSFNLIKYLIFTSLVIVIGIIDFKTQDVYLSTTITGGIFGVLIILIEKLLYNHSIIDNLLGALIPAAVISLIVFTTKGMGEGDIEIAALCGLFLGFRLSILMILLSFVLGGLVGGLLIVFKIKDKKDYIAFGPYIAMSAFLSIIWGNDIILWYFLLF